MMRLTIDRQTEHNWVLRLEYGNRRDRIMPDFSHQQQYAAIDYNAAKSRARILMFPIPPIISAKQATSYYDALGKAIEVAEFVESYNGDDVFDLAIKMVEGE